MREYRGKPASYWNRLFKKVGLKYLSETHMELCFNGTSVGSDLYFIGYRAAILRDK